MSLFMNKKERIEHQKWIADVILEKLFPIDPYAIVAGGAPRDWHFGNEAADIDVFFYTCNHTIDTVGKMLKQVGIDYKELKLGGTIPEWYKHNPYLMGVYCLEVEGVKVQLMRMSKNTCASVIPQFPLSICHAWYKGGNQKIHLGREFKISEKYKVVFKTSEIYNNSHAYIQKILAKFPEYKYYDSYEKFTDTLVLL